MAGNAPPPHKLKQGKGGCDDCRDGSIPYRYSFGLVYTLVDHGNVHLCQICWEKKYGYNHFVRKFPCTRCGDAGHFKKMTLGICTEEEAS